MAEDNTKKRFPSSVTSLSIILIMIRLKVSKKFLTSVTTNSGNCLRASTHYANSASQPISLSRRCKMVSWSSRPGLQQIKGFQLYLHAFSAGNDRRGKAIVAGDMCAAWPTAAFSRVSDHFTTVFNALSNCT